MPSVVSWRYDSTTEPWLRWCLLAGVAAAFEAYVGALAGLVVSLRSYRAVRIAGVASGVRSPPVGSRPHCSPGYSSSSLARGGPPSG